MDFFDMNLSNLFSDKHGNQTFYAISNKIIQEKSKKDDAEYVEIVFKVAFLDFFGLTDDAIKKLIEDTMLKPNVNVKGIKQIHKDSIKEIQKYLQDAMNVLVILL